MRLVSPCYYPRLKFNIQLSFLLTNKINVRYSIFSLITLSQSVSANVKL